MGDKEPNAVYLCLASCTIRGIKLLKEGCRLKLKVGYKKKKKKVGEQLDYHLVKKEHEFAYLHQSSFGKSSAALKFNGLRTPSAFFCGKKPYKKANKSTLCVPCVGAV